MMSRLEGEERRRSSGFPFSDKAPYPPPFLGPAPHTDMGYFKVQVCSLPQKHSVPLEKNKHNSLLVFVFARSIKLTLVQARADCQLVRQTMHGRVPAARKPKAAQRQTQSHVCFLSYFFMKLFSKDISQISRVTVKSEMQMVCRTVAKLMC